MPADPPLSVRPLGSGDLEACLALDGLALGGLWSAVQWQTELTDPARPGVGIWAGPHLVAMACAWLVVDELHITALAVHPEHRRKGLGHRVLKELLGTGRRGGAVHATLEVASGNAPARALYAGAGFREAGVRRHYYQNGDDAVIVWMRIPG